MSTRRDPEQDLKRLLDEDGGDFGAIYKRLSRPEPPRRLDRVIVANAARALHGGRAPTTQRWWLGLGSAAGIVLAAGIAWQVGQQIDLKDAQSSAPRSERAIISVEPISASARVQKSVAPDAAMVAADKEMPAAAAAKQESVPAVRRKASADRPARTLAPPLAPAPPPPAEPMIQPEPAPAPAMSTADEAQAFPEKKDSLSRDESARGAGGLRSDRAAGNAAKMSAPKVTPEQSRAPSPSSSLKLRQNMHLAPQDWLAEIVRLKNAGRVQEAIENLRLFRRMHPDWQLSDALRRLSE